MSALTGKHIRLNRLIQAETNTCLIQYQTSYWLYLGVRYDWLKDPTDDRLTTSSVALYASYYTTEFLRFRIGVEHRRSDIPADDDITTGLFEVNFVFGSHPTEPYWVNR